MTRLVDPRQYTRMRGRSPTSSNSLWAPKCLVSHHRQALWSPALRRLPLPLRKLEPSLVPPRVPSAQADPHSDREHPGGSNTLAKTVSSPSHVTACRAALPGFYLTLHRSRSHALVLPGRLLESPFCMELSYSQGGRNHVLRGMPRMRSGRHLEAESTTMVTATLARRAAIGARWRRELVLVAGNSQTTGQSSQLWMNVSTLLLQLNIISPH